MKHLPFHITPITTIPCITIDYTQWGGVRIKRDDLFQNAGGGSKARMLQYILAEINPQNCEVLVTAGGPCSNFNRACALQCAHLGIKMHLIAYTEHPDEFERAENFFLCNLTGVKITKCDKKNVADTISIVMSEYKKQGIKAINIYGGGRSLQGLYAYYDAVKEISAQCKSDMPKYVYVACGTGTTTAGLIAGFQEISPDTQIHAISVARSWEVEKFVINENIEWLNSYMNKNYTLSNLHFHDEFIMGEYGATTPELLRFIKIFTSSTGILIDPIYSGKALFGMHQLMTPSLIKKSLFWHTGAIYTLLSNKSLFSL